VASTRIFCRPSCPSRRPTRSGVEFFGSTGEAEQAGYRACKRCRPTSDAPSPTERAVAAACEYLRAHAEERVTLATLARAVGLSAFHLQRAFKRSMGISPREFQNAERRQRFTSHLRAGVPVSRATYEAGFGSSSRAYEQALGMTPAEVRRLGAGQRIQYVVVDSALGRLLVAYTERGVCSVAIGDHDARLERELRAGFPDAEIMRAGDAVQGWAAAIVASIDGGRTDGIPLDAQGTAFQWRVWNELQRIPRGTTLSYGDVARRIGSPSAVRAVARACATNPVALVVPCHRVVRGDGGLGGYRWGVSRKQAILDRERAG
jgi:AraC family transcriptional regulator, regulatory protein of adaptative response / methylated-DNA-[protein]-cysteine methyltransferase